MRSGSSCRTGRYCSKRPSGKMPYSFGPNVLSARMANITLSKTKESTPCVPTTHNGRAHNSVTSLCQKELFLIIHLHSKSFIFNYKTSRPKPDKTNLQDGTVDSEEHLARFFSHTGNVIRQTTKVQLITQSPAEKKKRKKVENVHKHKGTMLNTNGIIINKIFKVTNSGLNLTHFPPLFSFFTANE